MKTKDVMKRQILTLIICLFAASLFAQKGDVNILLITGGHKFDEEAFFQMFGSLKGVSYTHAQQPEANELYDQEEMEKYDVLVFYDMWKVIEDDQKQAFVNLLKKGKGIVFLHHSLVSYQDWPEFKNILGGKYHQGNKKNEVASANKSTFKHDVDIDVTIKDKRHFITKGMKDFTVFDEVYGNFEVLDTVHPLIATDHPESSPLIGWANIYEKSRIVYLQPGHGPQIFTNPNYLRLLLRSILWVSQN